MLILNVTDMIGEADATVEMVETKDQYQRTIVKHLAEGTKMSQQDLALTEVR
jgi:hypothetical protein